MQLEPVIFPVPDWDRYEFISLLGSGGMGDVYKAMDRQLRRPVALKFLRFENSELRVRFMREAQAQARLRHEHICEIYEVGQVEGHSYIAMQYIEGKSLTELMGELSVSQGAEIIRRVALALEAAHQIGLIHRDVKPANIIVEKRTGGELHPYIMDFGLVREMAASTDDAQTRGLTVSGTTLGTPGYMSPEQALGELHSLGPRADIYSLGATLYELVCGSPPFDGSNFLEIMMRVVQQEPEPLHRRLPDVPLDLSVIAMKCLEKDPVRRYDSALSLAEDLERFLHDEPIMARGQSTITRVVRKASRQKRLILGAVSLSFAILAAVILLYQLWSSRKVARYAAEYEQELQWMDQTLSDAYTAPLHDVRKEEGQVRDRLRSLGARIGRQGRFAQGPGWATLGRGYLALREEGTALKYLQTAWDKGYKTPQVGYALGTALGAVYQQEAARLDRLGTRERQERDAEIRSLYLQPASSLLKSSRSLPAESPEYAEGLIAFYNSDYQTSLEKAREAYRKTPWLYRAKVLEGRVYTALGNRHRDRGDEKEARDNYVRAQTAYQEALRRGRSDSDVYQSLCSLYAEGVKLQTYQSTTSLEAEVGKGIQACRNAEIARPDRASAYSTECVLYWRWADYQLAHGQDAAPTLGKGLAVGQRAVHLAPDDEDSLIALANTYDVRAYSEVERGVDATAALNSSVRYLELAAKRNPRSAKVTAYLGNSYWTRAQYEMGHGIDPTASGSRAIDRYRRTIALEPNDAYTHSNLAAINRLLAEYQMEHGGNPLARIRSAIAGYEKAISINPNLSYVYNNLGNAYRLQARYELSQDLDPRSTLENSIASYQKMIRILAEDPSPYRNSAYAYCLLAQYDMKLGNDPAPRLALAREACRKAVDLDPDDATTFHFAAEIELTAARQALARGLSPEDSLKKVTDALERARRLKSGYADAEVAAAEASQVEAQYHLSLRLSGDARKDVDRGLNAVARALRIDSRRSDAFALQGELLLQLAQADADPARKRDAATRSAAALEEALDLNRNLTARCTPSLQQARKLIAAQR